MAMVSHCKGWREGKKKHHLKHEEDATAATGKDSSRSICIPIRQSSQSAWSPGHSLATAQCLCYHRAWTGKVAESENYLEPWSQRRRPICCSMYCSAVLSDQHWSKKLRSSIHHLQDNRSRKVHLQEQPGTSTHKQDIQQDIAILNHLVKLKKKDTCS